MDVTHIRIPADDMRRRLTAKLRAMTTLSLGWSHGVGEPVSEIAVAIAERFVRKAAYMGVTADVFPNLDGGCAVTFYRDANRIEISVRPDRQLDLRIEQGIGFDFNTLMQSRNASEVLVDTCIAWL